MDLHENKSGQQFIAIASKSKTTQLGQDIMKSYGACVL